MSKRKPMSDEAVQALIEQERKWSRFFCCVKCDNVESRPVNKQRPSSCRLCGGAVEDATLEGAT